MTTIVVVTTENIAQGVREDCEHCPVALAIAAAFPGLTGISVGPDEISIKRTIAEDWIPIPAPHEAREFIWDFDCTGTGQPFSFELDYPAVTA